MQQSALRNISNTSDSVSSGHPNSGVFLTKFEVFG